MSVGELEDLVAKHVAGRRCQTIYHHSITPLAVLILLNLTLNWLCSCQVNNTEALAGQHGKDAIAAITETCVSNVMYISSRPMPDESVPSPFPNLDVVVLRSTFSSPKSSKHAIIAASSGMMSSSTGSLGIAHIVVTVK